MPVQEIPYQHLRGLQQVDRERSDGERGWEIMRTCEHTPQLRLYLVIWEITMAFTRLNWGLTGAESTSEVLGGKRLLALCDKHDHFINKDEYLKVTISAVSPNHTFNII